MVHIQRYLELIAIGSFYFKAMQSHACYFFRCLEKSATKHFDKDHDNNPTVDIVSTKHMSTKHMPKL